jgi:hypothetical protein
VVRVALVVVFGWLGSGFERTVWIELPPMPRPQ